MVRDTLQQDIAGDVQVHYYVSLKHNKHKRKSNFGDRLNFRYVWSVVALIDFKRAYLVDNDTDSRYQNSHNRSRRKGITALTCKSNMAFHVLLEAFLYLLQNSCSGWKNFGDPCSIKGLNFAIQHYGITPNWRRNPTHFWFFSNLTGTVSISYRTKNFIRSYHWSNYHFQKLSQLPTTP